MKRITGSFFDILHPNNIENAYWKHEVIAYRDDEWLAFMNHMKESGLDTIILIASVSPFGNPKALFPHHPFLQMHEFWEDFDPLESALRAADSAGLDFHIGLGLQETYSHEIEYSPAAVKRTIRLANSLLTHYSHHPSFSGWYIADEFGITDEGCFNPDPLQYVREVSEELDRLTPHLPRMISPYFHIDCAIPDPAKLQPQIRRMNVQTVSIQNGANSDRITEDWFVELNRAFRDTGTALWGNVELFVWEDPTNRQSPLVPGPIDRIVRQIEWIDPYVEKLISYQLMGLMNTLKLGKQPDAENLWHAYMDRYAGDTSA